MKKTYTAAEIRENRRKLAAALRSGEYAQCTSFMADETGRYCCLGVACVVTVGRQPTPIPGSEGWNGKSGTTKDYDAVAAALGAADLLPLWRANDADGKNFREIADMVDALPDPEAK